MNSVQQYREKAVQARRTAKDVLDSAVREQLEIAAEDYDEIADQLEESTARGK